MSRYRPPPPKKSKYITPQGAEALRRELKKLWKEERPKVTAAVAEAAAQGDRSENAEYIYGKKQLREIDRRIRYIQKRLDEIVIIDRMPDKKETIYFGAWVKLRNERHDSDDVDLSPTWYRIVGADEIDLEKGYISIDSPLATSLIKKTIGDEIVVVTPKGETIYHVIEIKYDA